MKKWLLFCLVGSLSLLQAVDHKWEKHKQKVMLEQKTIPGWCVYEKADKLMELIHETHPTVVVEIGVFGGSSVYPMAEALRYQKQGLIYAIDPWKTEDCQMGYTPDDPNYIWWTSLDLEKIYKDFTQLIKKNGLSNYCKIMRATSREAVHSFADESIDILHIDGNHTEDSAFTDATLFLPKVKKNGYIWFDDVNWSSTSKAVSYLLERCTFLPMRSVGNECYLFQKL
ncbi:MAG TPA: class I SAM-dependent methyltransferase [Chlamydiales bacterium]|jgi:predicted O-methyltransferase YrrM|nr:class I SAM-dependent methyltransferase [Chlamydiales bacterium]